MTVSILDKDSIWLMRNDFDLSDVQVISSLVGPYVSRYIEPRRKVSILRPLFFITSFTLFYQGVIADDRINLADSTEDGSE